jgi:hypothetical protein
MCGWHSGIEKAFLKKSKFSALKLNVLTMTLRIIVTAAISPAAADSLKKPARKTGSHSGGGYITTL